VTRRRAVAVVVWALVVASCGDLGLGMAECEAEVRRPTGANILAVQAVPDARYTPCLNELRLGWDAVDFFAENGEAGLNIRKGERTFLSATVTPSCDPMGAIKVMDWGHPDIDRFENVEFEAAEVGVTIIPAGEVPLAHARQLVEDLHDIEIDDRPVVFSVEENLGLPIASRVSLASVRGHYVWIISELDVAEDTLELRSDFRGGNARGITVNQALDRMDDTVPDVFYRGAWYFTFEGGCITYEFNAKGRLAETVAQDAEEAIGFYPAYQLRLLGEGEGFRVG
jgi:hypothetical protein